MKWEIVGFVVSAVNLLLVITLVLRIRRLRGEIRAKDERTGTVVHELRGLMQPIALAASRLKRDGGLTPRQQDAVEIIERNLEAERRLVEDLFDVTRGERPLSVRPEPCDLNVLVREISEAARVRAADKGIELEMRLDPGSPHALADPVRLRQILSNLVDNAIKFTPSGGRVNVRSDRGDGKMTTLEVADTGPGIPREQHERIFDPWVQLEGGRAAGGLGLGLFLARKLVVAQGGTLTVASAGSGQGTRFTVSLPRAPGAAAAAVAPAAANGSGRARVLIAEDHEDSARMIADLLTVRGYTVTSVGTVAAAVAEASKASFDVLVSDLELPDGSGLDLLPRLRSNGPVGGVAVSGRRTEVDLAASRAAGFGAHLLKPLDFDALVAAIEQVCR